MPNKNPTGINQPLDQHPLPAVGGMHIVGIDGTNIPNLPVGVTAAPTDTLLVPAPDAGSGVVRHIRNGEAGAFAQVNNDSGVITTVGDIVYKDGSGNEVLIGQFGPVGDGASTPLLLDSDFFLTEDDVGGGIYARVGAAAAVSAGVTAYAAWSDVRGVERYVVELTETKTGLLPEIPYGEALSVFKAGAQQPPSCWLLNYDTVAHGAVVVSTLFDAEGELAIPNQGAVTAGESQPFFDPETVEGHQGRGANINVVDGVGVTTTTPIIMVAVVRTNQGPVAPEQGGAF